MSKEAQQHFVGLVEVIMNFVENPRHWPLDDQGKNEFIRQICEHAATIKRSDFFAECLETLKGKASHD